MTNSIKQALAISTVILAVSCSTDVKTEKKNINEVEERMDEAKGEVLDSNDPRMIGGAKSTAQDLIEQAQDQIVQSQSKLLGYWVGLFGEGTINISLSKVSDSTVEGHTVCYGNFRPIRGKISKQSGNVYELALNEPGDDKYDGKFNLKIDLEQATCVGDWKPFKEKATSDKSFVLKKSAFVYNPENGTYPLGSTKLLEESDVDNLVGEELEIMRNEIYARHGYSFRNKKMRGYFAKQDWYVPMGVDIREKLTDIEAKNIQLIKRYESYFDEYYDDYGR